MGPFCRAKSAVQDVCRLTNRLRKRDKILLFIEFCVCLALVVLCTVAYPDLYRSKLWENGGVKGWNSNPKLRVYFYANHKEPPEIPLIWTQRLTDSNLATAVLSFVVHASRLVLLPLGFLPLWIETIYDIFLAALWSVSAAGQWSGDFSDPDHVSHHPWYLTRSCSQSWVSTKGLCQMAQATFALTILAMSLYICLTASHILDVMTGRSARGPGGESYEHLCNDVDSNFSDSETLMGLEKADLPHAYSEALSPVLAFFPESDGRWN